MPFGYGPFTFNEAGIGSMMPSGWRVRFGKTNSQHARTLHDPLCGKDRKPARKTELPDRVNQSGPRV